MRKYNYLSVLLLSLILCSKAVAQHSDATPGDYTKPIDIMPPSPDAAALGRYGGIESRSSSGTMSMDIPVYELASSNLRLPISLSYNSCGIRVDEIGSRLGMSWVMNAGGVISRTVFGKDDLKATRAALPADYPARSRALIDFATSLALGDVDNGSDGEPDVFTFNMGGVNGKFMLDANRQPVLLTHSNIKIEPNYGSLDWNFKITTGDGVEYYFGGTAVESNSKLGGGEGCGKIYHSAPVTSWYLNRIVHPNNDVMTFSYTSYGISYYSGIAQARYMRVPGQNSFVCVTQTPPNLDNTNCFFQLMSQVLLLQEINCTTGAKVKFNYIDRNDINNDKLLSGIEVYKPGQSAPFKLFSFGYTTAVASGSIGVPDNSLVNRPFLTSFVEKSPDNLLSKNYSFAYNDINGLPPRLSFSQDAWGFYNGKGNSSLIPTPSWPEAQGVWFDANANRNADPAYAVKGMLSTITYPTGGEDNIMYEGNTVYTLEKFYAAPATAHAGAQGTGRSGQVDGYSPPFTVTGLNQQVRLDYGASYDPVIGGREYDGHQIGDAELWDITNGTTNPEIVFTVTGVEPGHPGNQIVDLDNGHTYQIHVVSRGLGASTGAGFTYIPSAWDAYINKNVGGVRVAKIITSDKTGNAPTIKKYLYARLNQQDQSSGAYIYKPLFEKYLKVWVPCGNANGSSNCSVANYDFFSSYSNTQSNLYAFANAPITYQSIIESFGDNFENGGIQHIYSVAGDATGSSILGDFMPTAPLSDHSWENGREEYQYTFRKQGNDYIKVKEVYTHFNDDARVDQQFRSFISSKKYDAFCQSNTPTEEELNAFDLQEYFLFRKWSYVDQVRTLTYDNNGQNYIEEIVNTGYNNPNHAMPTTVSTTTSDGRSSVINNAYPYDITLSGSAETARQAMITKHIVSPVLQVQKTLGGNPVFTGRTDYSVFPNGFVLPNSQYVQTANNPIEKRFEFAAYNNSGKLLEQLKTDDKKSAYIWDNRSTYPIASVDNASQADIAYTSFETDGEGTWNIGSSARVSGGITGSNGYQLSNGSISKTGLNTSLEYKVSYWSAGGPCTVSGATGNLVTGKTISINGVNWTYYQHKVTGVSSVTISGGNNIDELRLCPGKALMTSYTYDPLVGVTSTGDANSKITYYEYDGLGRLVITRDQDRNVIKKICYNYAGQASNCN